MNEFIAIFSLVSILLIAYLKRQLTLSGSLFAFLFGLTLYLCGGWLFLLSIYLFFITSSLVSRIGKNYKKKEIDKIHEKSNKRDTMQVLSNSIHAVMTAIFYSLTKSNIFYILTLIIFACYNADTWASEVGVLSKKDPRYIIGFKKCPKGVSGGITLIGTISSFIGSLLIGILGFIFDKNLNTLLVVTLLGFLGSIIDSILGQLLQALYYYKDERIYTEKKYSNRKENTLVKGYDFINNDIINLLAPIIVSIIYAVTKLF